MTLGELRELLRLTLTDADQWPDATLDRWTRAAIRLYSAHFPRRVWAALELAAGEQAYTLPGAVSSAGVISVRYPAEAEPPRFLRYASEWSAAFASGAAVYAVRGVADEEIEAAGYIVFAEPVHDGETAVVEYWGQHPAPLPGGDPPTDAPLTVPEPHVEALVAYVEFAALYELTSAEAGVTDGAAEGVTIVLSQLGEEARRAWNRYKEVMDRLLYLPAPNGGVGQPVWARYSL